MPIYKYQTYNDIPKWLECPLCSIYNTHDKSYFLKHFNKCEGYDGHIDDILSYEFDENITIEDYMEQQLNCIETTKELIRTNELENIQNQTYSEIKEYIKRKIVEKYIEYQNMDNEIIYIYEFFFGESKESRANFMELVMKNI